MTFQKAFKENRKRNGYTQEEVATYLNVTPQAVSKWETGQGTPDLALIVPIAQLFNITTDELLGNGKDELLIKEELDDIRTSENDLPKKYELYKKLLKQSPSNVSILRSLINAACVLLGSKNRYELDAEKIDELVGDVEYYRNYILTKLDTSAYNEYATGKLAEAYIFSEKYDKAKDVIKDVTLFRSYNQDRLTGDLYYRKNDNPQARGYYGNSMAGSFKWMLHDLQMIGCTYADFKGQNYEKYHVQEFIKIFKTMHDIIIAACDSRFPYPYHVQYIYACELLAQGYMDIGDKETSLYYLEKLVSVWEEWKNRIGTTPDAKETCFMLSETADELISVDSIHTNYIRTVFNRNKYKRFGDDERFVSLRERAEKIIEDN